MLKFYNATYLLLLFKFILLAGLRTNLCGLKVLLFHEYSIHFVLYLYRIHYIIIIYFLIISFAQYKNKHFALFHLESFIMYYLLLLVQVLLEIFEV